MTAAFSRHHHLAVAVAAVLTLGLSGCGTSSSPNGAGGTSASTDGTGGAPSGTGGTTTATGGTTAGTGGVTTSTGGTTSDTSGTTTATGGRTTGTGGSTTGTGGSTTTTSSGGGTTATGGRTTGTGGSGTGGGPADAGADTGAIRNDGSARPDAAADTPPRADSAPEAGPNDAPAADTALPADAGIAVPDGYQLVWSDEFNVDGTPDPKNWTYEKGFARNEELQWYQPDNATVQGGLLVIEGRKERVANPNYQAGSSDWKLNRQYAEYTSTSMTTWNLQSWQYGRFEMRARIPTGAGMWPAWWTLGISGEWPSNGEIDIMEYYKGNILANVACGTATRWQAKWDSSTKAVSSLGTGWANDFHVWRMDWDDQKIDLYVDDLQMNTTALSSMLNADGTSPFKQKHYMLVNLAIGGVNGGDPAGTTFPVKYEVDWIRVFQKL
jgi:beta-glucanase (GH16 family)